ncbi:cAMP-dependent protein kinase [Aureococcus anophagefferens]|nr:cAMP-dependent protein kinase [Aureococcus anophagefferens]
MGAATSVAAQRADATVVELAPAAAVSAEAPAPGAADGPTGAPAVDRLALLAQQLDGSEEFLEAVASEAAPVRAVLQELGSGRFDGGDGDESPTERRRRRVSVLLESEDLDGLERELRSMKISDALYASVMGGVRTVLSFGFPRSRPADAPLELQLVKGKLARLEEDYAKLREENARLRLAAGQTSRDLRDRAPTTRDVLKACAALPYGSSDPAAVRDWLDAHVTSRAENDVERQRFAAVAAQLFESGADGPSLLERCAARVGKPPWFEVRGDHNRQKLDVKLVALKRFNIVLNDASGFGFYCLLYRSCGRLGPLQDFEWEALLGDGSFGQVHRCRNKHSGDPRAVKVVHVASGDLERAALEMEFQQVASALAATKVVRLETWGQVEEEYLFAVMEYAAGGELRGRIGAEGVDVALFWRWASQLADAVAELHARKLVHRDLKPENVLLTAAGDVRLADLGLARALRDEAPETMTVAGTLNYMAPELLAGKRASAKADTWSLAVIFFEMRTGSLPVHDDERAGDAVAEWEARVGRDLEDDARAFLRFVLVRDVSKRPQSADVAAYLRSRGFIEEPAPEKAATTAAETPRRASRDDDATTAEETRTRASRASRASRDDDAPPRAVVVDLGSATVKALAELALSALKSPRSHGGPPPATYVCPRCGVGGHYAVDCPTKVYVGDDAVGKRGVLALRTPLARGLVVDWEGLELIFAHTFYSEVGVEPGAQPLLLAESPLNPKASRERVAALVFDVFEVPSLYVNAQAVLSLYASGRTTGCVLDVGHDQAHAVPVFRGYAVPHAIEAVDAAGRDVTAHLERLLAAAGARLDGDVVCDVKEKLAYVALDYDAELELAEADVASARQPTATSSPSAGRASRARRCSSTRRASAYEKRAYDGALRAAAPTTPSTRRSAVRGPRGRQGALRERRRRRGTTLLPGFPARRDGALRLRKTSTHRVKVKIVAPPDRTGRRTGGSLLASSSTSRTCARRATSTPSSGPPPSTGTASGATRPAAPPASSAAARAAEPLVNECTVSCA